MCGRFTLTSPAEVVAELFELTQVPELPPRYNICPTRNVAAIRRGADGGARELAELRWGLIPPWAKDTKIGARMINARAETLSEKPSFRSAFKRRRCLVVADGFYEWKKSERGKQPYYIRMNDGRPIAFAGLWERWKAPSGITVESCTIITTEPNALMADLHNRMPVILSPPVYSQWLDPTMKDPTQLRDLLAPYEPNDMQADPVSTLVNSPSNDSPECVQPVASE